MAVIWRETKRDGSVEITRCDYETNEVELLDVSFNPMQRKAKERQLSRTNGFIGTKADLKKAMKVDAKLGVPIRYIATHKSHNQFGEETFAFRAEYKGRSHKNSWLRKTGRYDSDAGYSDPAPGWTKTSPEFRRFYDKRMESEQS